MYWLVLAMLLGWAGPALARSGVVAPVGGRAYQGQVRLTTQGLMVVNAAQNFSVEVAPTNLAWAVFDLPTVTAPAPAESDGLPEPWREADIGYLRLPGGTSRRSGTFTVRSSGMGILGRADSFHYVYQLLEGDTEILAWVSSVHQTDAGAKAGVMMRETLREDSPHVTLGVTPFRGGFLQWRSQAASDSQSQPQSDLSAPCWVKLKREANDFLAYKSPNGRQWKQAGRTTVPMGKQFYAGLATTSDREGVLNWTTFGQVETGRHLMSPSFPPRAELVSGSVVVGWPVSGENDSLDVWWNVGCVNVPIRLVARLIFQWASPTTVAALGHERAGVWMANGEFFEGDFRALDQGWLRISSVLFGPKHLDAVNDVRMIALRRSAAWPARFAVTTMNGSVWRAQSLAFGDNEVILREPVLGNVRIPIHELAAITRP